MDKKTMEDYFKDCLRDKPELLDETDPYMLLMGVIDLVHKDSLNNYELIVNQSELIDSFLTLMVQHKHCTKCGRMYMKIKECKCK